MIDPYETLGVSRDSDPETIKKSYRKLAKEHHPDTGGDESKITDLTLAYDILSNPDKKKRYDETGQSGPDNSQAQIYAEFLKMCEEILLKQEGMPIKQSVERIRAGIEQQMRETEGKIDHQVKILEAAKARIVQAPENDILGHMIQQRLDDFAKQKLALNASKEIAEKALDLFDTYEIKDSEGSLFSFSTVMRTGW